MTRRLLAAMLALSTALPAFAGPKADFEAAYRDAYASYRTALFMTNMGDAGKSAAARNALSDKWNALADRWLLDPPPHYADDEGFGDTFAQVSWLISKSSGQIVEGDLHGAHETLESIRDELAALHARNGIIQFSDRMNAYHAEMETVLMRDLATLDSSVISELHESAAVLSYLARKLWVTPPPEGRGNKEFHLLVTRVEEATAGFLAATRAGDAAAIRAAIGGLKKPYAQLFLKFG